MKRALGSMSRAFTAIGAETFCTTMISLGALATASVAAPASCATWIDRCGPPLAILPALLIDAGQASKSAPSPKTTPQSPPAEHPLPGGAGFSEEMQRVRSAARAALVKGLLDLATWCNTKELYLERDHVYARVLELEPDNLDARKGLRYARNPDGSWKDPSPREMKNRNPKALEELPAKRSESVAPYRDRLLEGLESTHADAAQRKLVYAEILAIDPDDARVHALLGEVEVDGKWSMPETASGKARRAEIKALVKQCLDAAPAVVNDTAIADEAKRGGTWSTALHSGGVRVLGTVSADECGRIARTCAAIGPFLEAALGCKSTYPDGFTFYVFGSPQEKNTFVEKLSDIPADAREYMTKIASVGLASTSNVLLGDSDPAKRLDGAVRHTLTHLLRSGFSVDDRQGWVWEGLGLYLTRELVGTRYTWFVSLQPDPTQDARRVGLLTPASNWMNEALKLFDSQKPPSLAFVCERELGQMHVEDMLCAYAFAAYCVEGRPHETPDLLRRVGGGDTTAAAVQDLFKLSMEEMQERLTRWLKERR
jgi:hypothetical protein